MTLEKVVQVSGWGRSFNEMISDVQKVEKMNCETRRSGTDIAQLQNVRRWKKKGGGMREGCLNNTVLFICLCGNTSISVFADPLYKF